MLVEFYYDCSKSFAAHTRRSPSSHPLVCIGTGQKQRTGSSAKEKSSLVVIVISNVNKMKLSIVRYVSLKHIVILLVLFGAVHSFPQYLSSDDLRLKEIVSIIRGPCPEGMREDSNGYCRQEIIIDR